MRDLLERHRSLQALIILGISALVIYIIQALWSALAIVGDVFLIFMLAWIITFILAPVSGWLERLRVPRLVAVSAVYLALLLAAVGVAALAAPALEAEVTNLASRVNVALSAHSGPNSLASQVASLLRLLGFSATQASALGSDMVVQVRNSVATLSNSTTGNATQLLNSIGVAVFDTTLVVIISFYMMLSGDVLVEAAVSRMPPKWLPDVRLFQRNISEIFAGFFRAQVIIGLIYAALTWLILAFFGQADAWFIALVAGALIWLPFIGPFLAVAPPLLLIAVVTPPSQLLIRLALVGVLLGAAQHIVLNVMAPRIFGQHMRVPTLILFAALMLGAAEGGVWGAFFAAPVIGVAYAMLEVFYERFCAVSPLFREERGKDAPDNRAAADWVEGAPAGRPTSPTTTVRYSADTPPTSGESGVYRTAPGLGHDPAAGHAGAPEKESGPRASTRRHDANGFA